MMRTRSARRSGFESISAQTGWRFRVRASMTTTGDRWARLRRRLPIGGSFERRAAARVSRPRTFVISMEPGLKPSARFMSRGSIGLPSLLRGIEARFRFRRRPVAVSLWLLVKRSFGHGYRQTAGSVKSQRLDGFVPWALAAAAGATTAIRVSAVASPLFIARHRTSGRGGSFGLHGPRRRRPRPSLASLHPAEGVGGGGAVG